MSSQASAPHKTMKTENLISWGAVWQGEEQCQVLFSLQSLWIPSWGHTEILQEVLGIQALFLGAGIGCTAFLGTFFFCHSSDLGSSPTALCRQPWNALPNPINYLASKGRLNLCDKRMDFIYGLFPLKWFTQLASLVASLNIIIYFCINSLPSFGLFLGAFCSLENLLWFFPLCFSGDLKFPISPNGLLKHQFCQC